MVQVKSLISALLVSMLLVAGAASYAVISSDGSLPIGLSNFQSKGELYSFLDKYLGAWARGGSFDLLMGDASTAEALKGGESYSKTNVQVEGVDEGDFVKTDGEFLYISHGDGVTIVRAYPPEQMGIVSTIPKGGLLTEDTEDLWVSGLFILEDRLVVMSSSHGGILAFQDIAKDDVRLWEPTEPKTYISVFDITRPEDPSLAFTYEIPGSLRTSRMTSNHVYVVTQAYIYKQEDGYEYPDLCTDRGCEEFDLKRVFYDPESEDASSFTNVLAVDPLEGDYDYISVIAGYASTVYMSYTNLYVTFPKSGGEVMIQSPLARALSSEGPVTSIYKVGVDGTRLWVAAGGSVSGWLLNQFSMDEQGPYLRVVTTTGWMESTNNVYVLDEEMKLVGALEGLAPRETVYSARFVGDALYLVTFKKVDPFFIIDLTDPTAPRVLGELKIPGFSEYLHPLDEGYVLGVGKEAEEADEGDFAWFQGLKLSLFDVTEVGNPREIAKEVIGDRGTSSLVLQDHKAFLYIQSRDLVIIPVDLALINESKYPEELPPFAYGDQVWQGAYVFRVSPEDGFEIVGFVAHFNITGDSEYDPYHHYPYSIKRSLYIGDFLYTVSDSAVRANSLADLSPAGHLVYRASPEGTKG